MKDITYHQVQEDFVKAGPSDNPAHRALWRQEMARWTPRFPGAGTIVEQSFNEGRDLGRAESILRVLVVRGIEIPEAVRERVVACRDLDVFDTWLDRSLTVTNTEELLAGT